MPWWVTSEFSAASWLHCNNPIHHTIPWSETPSSPAAMFWMHNDSRNAPFPLHQSPAETTNELNPLKGFTGLLTLVGMKRKGGENHLGLKSLIQRSYWINSKKTWLKFSGSDFGLYILLILSVHDCMESTDTICIRKTLSPGLWVQKLSRLCIEWKHEHVWCMRHQNGREEKKA